MGKLTSRKAWEVVVNGGRDEWKWEFRTIAADRETADFLVSKEVGKYAAVYDNRSKSWMGTDRGDDVEISVRETEVYSLVS